MDASQTLLARNLDVYSALTESKSVIFAAAIRLAKKGRGRLLKFAES